MINKLGSSVIASLAILLASASCQEATSPDGSTGIRVSVTTTGIDLPETVQIAVENGSTIDIRSNSSLVIPAAAGLHTIRIGALPTNCIADHEIRNDVLVPRHGSVDVSFAISCVSVVNRIQDQDIVFSRENDLYVIRSDGSGLVKLTNAAPGSFYRDPEWSPDGRRIAFTVFRDGMQGVAVMSADGPNVERNVVIDAFEPTWSPTGLELAFVGSAAIKITPAAGPTVSGFDGPSVNSYGEFPSWSQQNVIAFVKAEYDLSDNLIKSDIFTMTKTGEGVRQITSGGPNVENNYPVWSPDGRKLAFTRSQVCPGLACGIAVMNADGSDLRIIADDVIAFFPAWSPDGSQIVFASRSGLEIINSDGTARRFLAAGSYPSWRKVPAN